MKAIIITIGDELLIGQTVDTNSAWIGAELSRIGFDICCKKTIHDDRHDILKALGESAEMADVVIITGGLGPTSDDITKQTLCEFFNTGLVLNREVLTMIEKMMQRRHYPVIDRTLKQAEVPESCRVLTNAAGTAPGMWFEKDNTTFISMPGVPYEMKYIMTAHVVPNLKKRFTSQVIIHKTIMTYGELEAKLAERLAGFEAALPETVKLAYLPSGGIIKLRLTGTGKSKDLLTGDLEAQVQKLRVEIPDLIFSENEEPFEMVIGRLLNERGQTVCTAESCTGGNIAHMLTSVPGSSDYYRGSVIAYDNRIKQEILNVPADILGKYGAVSEETARMMAEGARKLLKVDFAVATTGIAGPDGGSEAKPVGTVCLGVASTKETVTRRLVFGSERTFNITRFSIAALNMLRIQIIRQ